MQLTARAEAHEPTGDPEHVAYGADYVWRCDCGKTGNYVTTKSKAESRAKQHERYCNGETTVDTIYE